MSTAPATCGRTYAGDQPASVDQPRQPVSGQAPCADAISAVGAGTYSEARMDGIDRPMDHLIECIQRFAGPIDRIDVAPEFYDALLGDLIEGDTVMRHPAGGLIVCGVRVAVAMRTDSARVIGRGV